jgi:hypothetical protein
LKQILKIMKSTVKRSKVLQMSSNGFTHVQQVEHPSNQGAPRIKGESASLGAVQELEMVFVSKVIITQRKLEEINTSSKSVTKIGVGRITILSAHTGLRLGTKANANTGVNTQINGNSMRLKELRLL